MDRRLGLVDNGRRGMTRTTRPTHSVKKTTRPAESAMPRALPMMNASPFRCR